MTASDDAPNPIDLYVGARLRLRRKELGRSQSDLADALGLTFQQVQKYERGANRISASKLHEASKFLGVTVSYFYDGFGEVAQFENGTEGIAQRAVEAFLMTQEGIELAECFPRIRAASHRRKILGLVTALAEDAE